METPMLLTAPVIDPQCLEDLDVILRPTEIDFLVSRGAIKEYKKNTLVVRNGDQIHKLMFLTAGRTRMIMTGTDGSEKICMDFAAGCFLAEAGFFHSQPVIFDLHVLEESKVLSIEKDQIQAMLKQPNITLYLLKQMGLVSRVMAYQLEDATLRTTKQTICRILYCLSGTEHSAYKPHFTHQEIADLAGVHRVTVTNTLSILKNEGIVEIQSRGHVAVSNRSKLYEKIYEER